MPSCQTCGRIFEPAADAPGMCSYCRAPVSQGSVHSIIDGIDVRLVAQRQRRLIWCVLIMLFLSFVGPFTMALRPPGGGLLMDMLGLILPLCVLGFTVLVVVWTIATMNALRMHIVWRILYAPLLFFPLVGLLCLLSVNRRATTALRKAGLRVGFMGVDDDEVVRRLSRFVCTGCGYDLTGNVSGFCSECGTEIPPEKLRPVIADESVRHPGLLSDTEFRRACRLSAWQRRLVWVTLACAVCFLLFGVISERSETESEATAVVLGLAAIAVLVLPFVVFIITAISLPWHPVWKVAVGVVTLIPFANLITLLIVSGHIVTLLREMGFRVGFLGVSRRSLREQRAAHMPVEFAMA